LGVAPRESTAAVETVFKMEFPGVVATLARVTRDIDLAEELAQEALVEALRKWPESGIPQRPGAWLTTVARRRAIDRYRRQRSLDQKYAEVARELSTLQEASDGYDLFDEDQVKDDRLRLVFVACHPLLPVASRAALTLRVVGGLSTGEIARAYLVQESTIYQRILRAKRSLAEAGVAFEIPEGEERLQRLDSVLEVIYLIFNEGYSATSGEKWMRADLCAEGVRLGRVLAGLMPEESEVHGLLGLMELQSSRLRARVDQAGSPVLLLDQDRRRWDRLHITRGKAALSRAEELAERRGPYLLQAAIAACHADALRPEETDWRRIVELYTELAAVMPSPVVELNRAVAIAMAGEPAVGLSLVEQLADLGVLDHYHLLHSVRGDLLERLGRLAQAADAFERAGELTTNEAERLLLRGRAEECAKKSPTA
jgi:RNA polymerase sigma factor (sigma-70 family)